MNPDNFMKSELAVTHDYSFMSSIHANSEIRRFYEAVIAFMKNGVRSVDIHNNTLRMFDYFGLEGFLEQDALRLVIWAEAIIAFGLKVDILPDRVELKDVRMFDELVAECKMI